MILLGTQDGALGQWRGRWIQEQAGQLAVSVVPVTDPFLALAEGAVDAIVVDALDLPVAEVPGVQILAVCARGDLRDTLVGRVSGELAALPAGLTVGARLTSRLVQLQALRPDLTWVSLTGDTEAQLAAVEAGTVEAVVVSYADLSRLGLAQASQEILPPETCLPPVGQGATVVLCRAEDTRLAPLGKACDHFESRRELACELLFRQAWQEHHTETMTACALASDRFLYLFSLVETAHGTLVRTRNSAHPSRIAPLVAEAKANLEQLLRNT